MGVKGQKLRKRCKKRLSARKYPGVCGMLLYSNGNCPDHGSDTKS